jgi:DNA-binding transcriptional ArsR family regulator
MTLARISHARAVRALDALAHDTRLKVHRLLVQAGEDGLSAGFIARKLALPASSLSFHLTHCRRAGCAAPGVAELCSQFRRLDE